LPFRQQREAVGHAVRANYLYAGAADLYLEIGDNDLLEALNACWESVQLRKIYVTGGCGALYDGASPEGSSHQSSITRIHQAYGRNYQLPNSTAHNETCAAVGNVLWNQRMWQAIGHVKYIDALENSLYNAVLAGVSLNGQDYFYTNTLRQLDSMPVPLRWNRHRQPWISCYCCPPNVVRTVAGVGRYAYTVDERSATVLLYGSNQLKTRLATGHALALRQSSRYPIDGKVEIVVDEAPATNFAIKLRAPGWCTRYSVKLNGRSQAATADQNGLIVIDRQWKPGDRIDLVLQMEVQLLTADPLVEECTGQVAVRRGPLIYCVESIDLPEGTSVQAVRMPPDPTVWTVVNDRQVLDGVPVLEGQLQLESAPSTNPQTLYRKLESGSLVTVRSRLIPYFAWDNRGPGEMTVWIRLGDQ
jgi:hypothetical protein